MSDQRNTATYRAVTGGRSPRSEPQGWFKGLTAVVAQAGSVAGAARELGVPRRTLRRWLTGEGVPSKLRQAQVAQAASVITRRARLVPARESRLRKARTVTIVCVFRYDGDTRQVTFHVGQGGSTGMDAGTVGQLINGYLSGEPGNDPGPGLFDHLVAGMTDDWYREQFSATGIDEGFNVEKVIIK